MHRLFIRFFTCIFFLSPMIPATLAAQDAPLSDFTVTKPFTRWWWFAAEIDTADIQYQLNWIKSNEFGGVEIAFIYPFGGEPTSSRHEWLSPKWTRSVSFAKQYATSIGLACDFTFGTLWPFGDSQVPPGEGSLNHPDTLSEPTMRLTWEHPVKGRVLNHLSKPALENYAQRMISGLRPALTGSPSALFCDSWEVNTRKLTTPGFDEEFERIYGYGIRDYYDSLYLPGFERIHYDYIKLVSDYVLYNFYGPFSEITHQYGAFSRVQCGGTPADLLTAFSLVDIPETEALLFEPAFARIPASAAILSSRPIVSAEAFTCLYGWKGWPGPGPFQGEEQIADIKLVADALFANGVNMIVWHGMPFNPEGDSNRFYASVHVGPDAAFSADLPPFNQYLQKISEWMRIGKPYASMAVYLPLEDSRMNVEYPDSLQYPWAWGEYELRYVKPAEEIRGYQPCWINQEFLLSIRQDIEGNYVCGDAVIGSLYIDVAWMEYEALRWILLLAQNGLPVCLKQQPAEPGTRLSPDYQSTLNALNALPNVSGELAPPVTPLIEGNTIPEFWCRQTTEALYLFFANPKTAGLRYPMAYGQSFCQDTITREITINHNGYSVHTTLTFEPYQSLLLRFSQTGEIEYIPIEFVPTPPKTH